MSLLLAGCSPRVATSFWRIGTPADSTREGYAVLYEGKKMRHCYPVTEATDHFLPPLGGERGSCGERGSYYAFHHHGVAVESELMAYRIYFDKKQTIDPYCKRKPQLELAQSYWYPNDSLLAEGYGDDILRVSGTVGVGSVKYWNGKKMVHFENVGERSERIVSQSRNSATIEVAIKDWQPSNLQTNGQSPSNSQTSEAKHGLDLSVQYTMQAGHRDMRCDVFCSSPVEGLCTGVQSIPAKSGFNWDSISSPIGEDRRGLVLQLPNGVLLASWGTDWPVNDSAKYAKETVGLGVFIPHPYAGELVHDKQNNLCLLKPQITNHPSQMCATAHFYLTCCGATKENHSVATTAEEWFTYLRRWAKKLK